ncbi:MAG TPA: hypothetical protein VHA13_00335, partial [Gammaproteobacteria bacterium]|nr:hypothetical protein [Gammaproteobacteria bacterium]
LEQLAEISNLAPYFAFVNRDELGPVFRAEAIIGLQESIRKSLASLSDRTLKAFNSIYNELLQLNNIVAPAEFKQEQNLSLNHPSLSLTNFSSQENKEISNIESTALKFETHDKNTVKIMPQTLSQPAEAKTYQTFFNMFVLLNTFLMAQNKSGAISHKCRIPRYENSEVKKTPNQPLTDAAIWESLCAFTTDSDTNFFSELMQGPLNEITKIMSLPSAHSKYALNNIYLIPKLFFDKIDNFSELKELLSIANYQRKVNSLIHLESIYVKSSVEILKNILSINTNEPLNSAYIRKVAKDVPSYENFLQEFVNPKVDNLAWIKPATMVIPGIPIKSYHGKRQLFSGLLQLVGPGGNLAMAGYKRPACSQNLVNNTTTTLGFPYATESFLRPQGGKPSFNFKDMHERLVMIDGRYKRYIEDVSRKEMLLSCFIRFENIYPDINLNLPFQLTLLATEYFKGNHTLEELDDKDKTGSFDAVKLLVQFIKDEIDIKTKRLPIGFKRRLDLFFEVFNIAVINSEQNTSGFLTLKPLKQVLIDKIEFSVQKRKNNFHKNIRIFYPESKTQIENIHHEHYALIISSGNKYANNFPSNVYLSNEVMLQGIRIKNIRNSDVLFNFAPETYSELEFMHEALLKRHGNTVAVYANVSIDYKASDQNKARNARGIIDAIKLYKLIDDQFGQDLPFVTYDDEGLFQVYSYNEFISQFGPVPTIEVVQRDGRKNFVVDGRIEDYQTGIISNPLNFLLSAMNSQSSSSNYTSDIQPIRLALNSKHPKQHNKQFQSVRDKVVEQLKACLSDDSTAQKFAEGYFITELRLFLTAKSGADIKKWYIASPCYLSKTLVEKYSKQDWNLYELKVLINTIVQQCNEQIKASPNTIFETDLFYATSEFPKLHYINTLIEKYNDKLITSFAKSIQNYFRKELSQLELTYPAVIGINFPIACVPPEDSNSSQAYKQRHNFNYSFEITIENSKQFEKLVAKQHLIKETFFNENHFLSKFQKKLTDFLNKIDTDLSQCELTKGYEPVSKVLKTASIKVPSSKDQEQQDPKVATNNNNSSSSSSSLTTTDFIPAQSATEMWERLQSSAFQNLIHSTNNPFYTVNNAPSVPAGNRLTLSTLQPTNLFFHHNNSNPHLSYNQQLPQAERLDRTHSMQNTADTVSANNSSNLGFLHSLRSGAPSAFRTIASASSTASTENNKRNHSNSDNGSKKPKFE